MKIALINTYDSKDVKIWSGIPYYVSFMLERMFKDNIYYIKLPLKRNIFSYIMGFYYNRIIKKNYLEWTKRLMLNLQKSMI